MDTSTAASQIIAAKNQNRSDARMSSNPIIPAGSRITCESGHLIATAKMNIGEFADHRMESYDFAIDPQGNGARCPTCGALYQLMTGPSWETSIIPRDNAGNPTAPPLTARRVTGVNVHTQDGWVMLGQTAGEWLAQHPEADAEINKQLTNINAR